MIAMTMVALLWGGGDGVREKRPIDGFIPTARARFEAGYCGIYSVYAAARACGVEKPFTLLTNSKYVGSTLGSSATELVAAAQALDLEATLLVDLTATGLEALESPAILHVRLPGVNMPYSHWVVYLGTQAGKARILDPADGERLLPFAELLSHWNGVAVLVNKPDGPTSPWFSVVLFDWCFWVGIVGGTLFIFTRLHPGKGGIGSSLLILSLTVVTAVLVQSTVMPLGFTRNGSAVGAVKAHSIPVALPEIDLEEVRKLQSQPDVVLIDARGWPAYQHRHIPGAVCLPVDSSLSERLRFIGLLPASPKIVVYCQSSGCSWGDAIAADLYHRGFKRIVVFRGGMNAWDAAQRKLSSS